MESNQDKEHSLYKDRHSFMKLPMEDRRKILTAQAENMVTYYEKDSDITQWQGGDIIEY